MSGDDSSDTLSFGDAYERRTQKTTESFDRAHGFVPSREVDEGPFSTLINRASAAVFLNQRDPSFQLVKIGRFEVLECLGRGGFGAVFKARDTELDRLVALKLFRAGSHTEEDLRREARALARVEHDNVVQVYDLGYHEEEGEDENALFIVMQHVKAVSLWSYAVEELRPWSEILELFMQVGEALTAIHDADVVHGDFKPDNVIVDASTKTAYIVDFGLAKIIAPDFEEVVKGGTRLFMARELLLGGTTSMLADLYAFCASLWLCLDHRPPYVGNDSAELLEDMEVVAEDVCFVDETIPERVREVLVLGLAPEPEQRHANMRVLLHELELARGPVLVPEPVESPVLEPSSEAGSRLPGGVLVYTILGGLFGAMVVALLMHGSPTHDDDDAAAALHGPQCVLDGVPTADVSPELEVVCQHIRGGRLDRAFQVWTGVRTTREPKYSEPDELRRQTYEALGKETRIVADTYAEEARVMDVNGGAPGIITIAQRDAAHWELVATQYDTLVSELAPSE